jgi:multidrug efflux pump subunit AcrA (membrane-fusion protein)
MQRLNSVFPTTTVVDRPRTVRFGLAAGVFLVLLPLAACGPKAPVAADQPVAVQLRQPRQVVEPVMVAASGEVEANVSSLCAFQVTGRVNRVFVEEGQPVRKGQLLATLDAADYQNAFDAASGQAVAAQAVASKAKAGLRAEELAQARIEAAQQNDQYTRMKYLYEHQSLPANDFHKIEAAYRASVQRLHMAEEGTRVEDKASAEGQSQAAVAQRHEAGKRLADTRLTAPVAGFVGMKKADVGNTVSAGTPVFSVLDLDPVKVRVAIAEAQIGRVHAGARAQVVIPSLGGRRFEGKVDAVGVAADAASRTYTVKITVPNHDHLLRAGMIAEARIYAEHETMQALTVPGDAIVRDARGVTLVYVFDPSRGRVDARRVEPGDLVENEVAIRTGLKAGEQIVVAGQQNVREGARVTGAGR